MNTVVTAIEKTAGYCIGVLALITFGEAVLRYVFRSHIPDGFVIGELMQGIAICWGIATAVWAGRHITVDIVYLAGSSRWRRICDVTAYTLTFAFLAAFGYAITFKVFDIMEAGEISPELSIPIWTGYSFAALGVLAAVVTSALRWWQVTSRARRGSASHG